MNKKDSFVAKRDTCFVLVTATAQLFLLACAFLESP